MKAFAKQLIAMEAEEAKLNEDLLNRDELGTGYHPDLRELHQAQADTVAAVIESKGWPTLKDIGEDAYDGLFMVALNAISRPKWMKRAFEGFSSAKDSMAPGYAAYLSDRIAYFERRPQLYATQWDVTVEGETVLWSLENPEGLNMRRAKAGLDTFQELDFSLHELNLGQGLKRTMSKYHFLYQVGWLTPSDLQISRLFELLEDYESGGILGPNYSRLHYQGLLGERKGPIDIIMPLQHKDAFEAFLREEGHTIVTKGLKYGTYALKDDLGFIELKVQYLPFEEDEQGWVLGGTELLLKEAAEHTPNGWLLTEKAMLQGQSRGLFSLD